MGLMKEIYTYSPEETAELGKSIGRLLKAGDVIAFRGGMGAGKTTLTRGIAIGMGLGDEVTSPTFALVNEYRAVNAVPLYHFDVYRLGSSEELEAIGFYDYFDNESVIAIEWSEIIADVLPEDTIVIELERLGESERKVTIFGGDRFDTVGD